MPKILEKRKVLNGRGIVGQFGVGTSEGKFFYREKVEGKKVYKFKVLPDAKNLDEAELLAADAAIALRDELKDGERIEETYDPMNLVKREEKLLKRKESLAREEKKKENPKISIEKAMEQWLIEQKRRVDAGTFSQNSYEHKLNCSKHIMNFLQKRKVDLTSQITNTTFDQYPEFRMRQTKRRIVIHRELAVLGEFIKSFLVKHKYIPAHLWLDGQFLPRITVRETDKDANPAINQDDWRTIIDYIREEWRPLAYEKDQFGRIGEIRSSHIQQDNES